MGGQVLYTRLLASLAQELVHRLCGQAPSPDIPPLADREKERAALLQILVKYIIVDPQGEIIGCEGAMHAASLLKCSAPWNTG